MIDFFERKVRPVLANNCNNCHSANTKASANLRVDDRNGLVKGGNRGPAIVPGNPDGSLLIKAVRYLDPDLQMPPKDKKLSNDQVALLEAWVKAGAPMPNSTNSSSTNWS